MHQLTINFWYPLFLLALTMHLAAAEERCTNCHTATYNGFRYTLYKYKVPWFNAFEICRLQDEFLLSVLSMAEFEFITKFLTRAGMPESEVPCVWTSGTDVLYEGKHIWQSNGRPVPPRFFGTSEPSGRRVSNCDAICKYRWYGGTNFHLDDIPCVAPVYYICKKPQ